MVKRPILIACIGYILGIIYGLYLNILSIAIFFSSILIIYILKSLLNKNAKRFLKVVFSRKMLIILLIFFLIGIIYIFSLNKKYENFYNINEAITVTGVVEEVETKEYNNKYIIKVKSVDNKKYMNTKFILYTNKTLEYGNYIKLKASYSKPEVSRNYKGFSYANYLKQNSIYGIIKPIDEIEIIEKEKVNFLSKVTNEIRNTIIYQVNSNLSENASAVFLGILLGEKSQISDEVNTYFRQGNMAHLLAVSGAHVSYIIIAVNILLGKTGKKIYLLFTIFALTFFMLLTNFSPSVVRACMMSIIAILAKLIHRKSDIYNNLGLSAILILIINPYTILNIGFQLTYLGTIGIILVNKKFSNMLNKKKEHKYSKLKITNMLKERLKRFILNSIIISLSVQILIFPIILLNFNTISYNFLISGIISTPIFAMIMIVGILFLIFFPFRYIFFPIIEVLINLLIFISKIISKFPFSTITIPTPNIIWIIAYYLILFCFFISKSNLLFRIIKSNEKIKTMLKRIIVVILIVCLSFGLLKILKDRDLMIYFIDVGQGDSSLIITPKNKVILIDGGGSSSNDYDVGKSILFPYLLDRGIISIDYIIISHFDSDHVRTDYYM